MRLRFTARRSVIAATALTLALGSAAAYANLDSMPGQETVDKIFKSVVDTLDNVASHIIGHKDSDGPSDGKVSVPGTDILPIPGVTTPAAKASKAAKAKPLAPAAAPDVAPASDNPIQDIVKELTSPADPAPAPAPGKSAEDDLLGLGDLFEEPLVKVPESKYGEGWNFCNNNNHKEIINENSHGSVNEIEQKNSGGSEGANCK
jgi:hypothetical protein